MKRRQLGAHGPAVSEIGFGGWALGGQWGDQDDNESIAALHAAIDAGVNLIDTAPGYGEGRSEQVIARVLRERGSTDLFVATKTPPAEGAWPPSPYCRWEDRYAAAYIRDNVHQRLTNLGVDRLDLLQLHTWTRAWNDDPQPLLVLRQLKDEGKIRLIGLCTPEQDQNCVIQLMRDGLVDVVQVIFNLFEQEAAAQIFSTAAETGTGVIVRVPLDEGALSGKYGPDHRFSEGDFRQAYFAGDRMARTVARIEAVRQDCERHGVLGQFDMADVAIKFALNPPEVSTVIVGTRSVDQATRNARISGLPELPAGLLRDLRRHHWLRGVWYGGK
ncbi:MAG: aldo/keto reductase [Planctomycetaceae bacterium]|nr:MAG: aldo/keto reductase [Planctomycetaceae bacterium]